MKKHNLNDFAAAIAHGAGKVAYNMNTGELYTEFSFTRVGQLLHRSADDDSAVIKSRVAELIKLDYIEAMHEDVFIVCEFYSAEDETRTLWSLALVHPETDGY
jgi:hypothetical protein